MIFYKKQEGDYMTTGQAPDKDSLPKGTTAILEAEYNTLVEEQIAYVEEIRKSAADKRDKEVLEAAQKLVDAGMPAEPLETLFQIKLKSNNGNNK